MELLIAFLLTFGYVTGDDAAALKDGRIDAKQFVVDKDIEKDFIIWEAEADDF
jgi:hypothetical protein